MERALPEQTVPVEVTFFDAFSIKFCNVVLNDSMNRSTKIWNLLAYVLYHRDRHIPQAEFIELLWPDGESDNPQGSLKTMFFRLRRILNEAFDTDTPFILSQRGSYCWNPDIACTLDVNRFDALCRQADGIGLDDEQRLALYEQALSLYAGSFLPKLTEQLWVIPLATYYHNRYIEVFKRCIRLLERAGRHADMISACLEALRTEPFDEELYILLFKGYRHQGNFKAIINDYRTASDLFFRHLGIYPSEDMSQIYLESVRSGVYPETDLTLFQQEMRDRENLHGAFICDSGFFKQAFALIKRQALRNGSSVHLALLTTPQPPEPLLHEAGGENRIDTLVSTILSCLRKDDIVSLINDRQIVIVLANANYEDSLNVLHRIRSVYRQRERDLIDYAASVQPIDLSV
ncbi:MAG: hypothetical protein GXX99_01260 [Clostridiales bacterium]|nr:hypothetical protein [Clostridiales bacterium]